MTQSTPLKPRFSIDSTEYDLHTCTNNPASNSLIIIKFLMNF